MLKFKGKPWELKCFWAFINSKFGAKTTIKELTERIK